MTFRNENVPGMIAMLGWDLDAFSKHVKAATQDALIEADSLIRQQDVTEPVQKSRIVWGRSVIAAELAHRIGEEDPQMIRAQRDALTSHVNELQEKLLKCEARLRAAEEVCDYIDENCAGSLEPRLAREVEHRLISWRKIR